MSTFIPKQVAAFSVSAMPSTSQMAAKSTEQSQVAEITQKRPTRKSMIPSIGKLKVSSPRRSKAAITFQLNSPSTSQSNAKPPRKSLSRLTRKSMASTATATTENSKNATNSKLFLKPPEIFQCNVCKKTFRLQTSLKSHQKTHVNANMCKYCDRKFALETALDAHLQQNCTKIPFTERKKMLRKTGRPRLASEARVSRNSDDSDAGRVSEERKYAMDISNSSDRSTSKKAHYGVYRTPSKPIVCNVCKIVLPDIISFTSHVETHSRNNAKKIEFTADDE